MENTDYTKNLDSDKMSDNRDGNTSASSAQEKEKIDVYKYEDVQGGMSTKELDVGLWFVKSKGMFKKLFIISLIIISAISWTYSIYHFAYYVAKGMQEDQKLLDDMVNSTLIGHDYIVQISAQNISASSVLVFPLGDNKYDFLVELKNPNFRYWVDFKYCFYSDTENIICDTEFLMPGESKYIIELAKEIDSGSKNIRFTIDNISWQRINLHKYPDWSDFRDDHLNVPLENIDFKSTVQSGLSDKLGYNSLEFTVFNKTPYNYWSVDFNILLRRGEKIISVNKYNLQEFISGETRELEISWPGKLSNISDIKIIPIINILDQDNYIDYEGGSGLEK